MGFRFSSSPFGTGFGFAQNTNSVSSSAKKTTFSFPPKYAENISPSGSSWSTFGGLWDDTSGGFGQTSNNLSGGSSIASYHATKDMDSSNMLQSISAMQLYNYKSHEELRSEDYKLNDKGSAKPVPSFSASANSLFGTDNPFAPRNPNPFSYNFFAPQSQGFGFPRSTTTTTPNSAFFTAPSTNFFSTPSNQGPSLFSSVPAPFTKINQTPFPTPHSMPPNNFQSSCIWPTSVTSPFPQTEFVSFTNPSQPSHVSSGLTTAKEGGSPNANGQLYVSLSTVGVQPTVVVDPDRIGRTIVREPADTYKKDCLPVNVKVAGEASDNNVRASFRVNVGSIDVDDVSSLMPKLPPGEEYYTEPSIEELEAKEISEPGFCSHVKDFVVGRKDKGSIKFLGETDVCGLDIESIVQFNDLEVVVYLDGSKKPPVGQGLNKPAEVTLLNVKCFSKLMGKQYIDGPQLRRYEAKLMEKAEEIGAEFSSYDPVQGEWKFRVQQF